MGDQSPPTDPSSPSVNSVSYQTAFWTLIPLAISTMTQPSGRVLLSPPYYRTYLRSSPILCIADALFFILRLLLSPLILRIPVSQSIAVTLRERYRGVQDPVEGIQYLERQTWLRWLWFVVGDLGAAVKLVSLQGVPWTKAWGMMFLGAFVVFEGMVVLGGKGRRVVFEAAAPDDGFPMPSLVPDRVNERISYIDRVEKIFFSFTIMAHIGVLIWALLDIWMLRTRLFPTTEEAGLQGRSETPALITIFFNILFLIITVITAGFFVWFLVSLFNMTRNGKEWIKHKVVETFLAILAIGGSAEAITALTLALKDQKLFMPPSLLVAPFFSLTFITPLLLFWLLQWSCTKYPALSAYLLMVPHQIRGEKPPNGAMWTFMFFIANLTVCTLWYCLRYNPAGTVNPSRTGIFG